VGAASLTVPSSELYQSMQTGACDVGVTSSTSLISFRLEEVSKHLTSGRGKSFWFMLEPLMMSKMVFDALPKAHQELIMKVGAELEPFGTESAKADDDKVVEVYKKAGAQVHEMDAAIVEKWTALARDTAWKDFAERKDTTKKLLELALKVT
jgi:TRAP-type C4-dicarboxylate transport system substrate-binding protein